MADYLESIRKIKPNELNDWLTKYGQMLLYGGVGLMCLGVFFKLNSFISLGLIMLLVPLFAKERMPKPPKKNVQNNQSITKEVVN
jgi:hypothetical protein